MMSSQSSDGERKRPSAHNKGGRSGGSRASTHKSGGAAAAAQKRYQDQPCGLCLRSDPAPTKTWRKGIFHKEPCWRVMRNNHQSLAKTPGALTADAELWAKNPDQWRKDNQAQLAENPEVRKQARRSQKLKWSSKKKIKGKRDVQQKLRLNKRHFKGWKRNWEAMESDEASMEFDQKFDEQGLPADACTIIDTWKNEYTMILNEFHI